MVIPVRDPRTPASLALRVNGRYPIARPGLSGGLRTLRDPTAGEEDCCTAVA